MNLLIFPQYAFPANHAVVNTVYEDLLPRKGHTVHMVRPMAGIEEPQQIQAPWANGSIVGYPEEPSGRPLQNVSRFLRERRWLDAALRMLTDTKLDVILVRNDLTAAFAAGREARRRGIPLVFQISSADAELMASDGREQPGFEGLYRRVRGHAGLTMRGRMSRRAAAVLSISDAMREYLVEKEGLDPGKVFAFPMGVLSEDHQSPESPESLRQRLNLPAGKTIVYCGVLDPVRKSAWMLDVLALVRQRVDGAVLLVVTYQTDARRKQFEEDAQRRCADVRMVGPVPFRDVEMYLRAADVMISPVPAMPEHRMSSPTKTLEGLRASLPVVGSAEVDEHRTVFEASGGGVAVPWDTDQFAGAIVSLLQDPDRRRAMGARGREWVLRHRTYARLTDYLERILGAAASPAALRSLPHSP